MERELFTKLERWMNKKNRRPMILTRSAPGRKNLDYEGIWSQFCKIQSISILIIIKQ